MPLPTWHIVDELRRAAGFRQMMTQASDANEASIASDSKDADLMGRAAKRLEELEVALDTLRKTQTAQAPKHVVDGGDA